MAVSRYIFAKRKSEFVGPSPVSFVIKNAVDRGVIKSTKAVVKEHERLDQISSRAYGDPSYWWVIAAASAIGWGMQVPPGVIVTIPTDLSEVLSILG